MQALRCPHRRRHLGGLAAPFHGHRRLSLGHPLFQVDLLDCLGFGSRPDGRAARLRGQRRPSLGLQLLGRPLGALDTQRGRLRFVIRNVARPSSAGYPGSERPCSAFGASPPQRV